MPDRWWLPASSAGYTTGKERPGSDLEHTCPSEGGCSSWLPGKAADQNYSSPFFRVSLKSRFDQRCHHIKCSLFHLAPPSPPAPPPKSSQSQFRIVLCSAVSWFSGRTKTFLRSDSLALQFINCRAGAELPGCTPGWKLPKANSCP